MGASDLPVISGRLIVRCLVERFGLMVVKRSDKNHWILEREGLKPAFISIPDHREVKRDLLAAELKVAGIDHKEFARKFRS